MVNAGESGFRSYIGPLRAAVTPQSHSAQE
jgi:hypothetical protein